MWIEDFRRANGYTRQQFSTALRAMAHRRRLQTVCPPELIYMLETIPGCVTHPQIANLIAEATGATPEQRDSIVHKKHRGHWKPPRIVPLKRNATPAPCKPDPMPAPMPAFTPPAEPDDGQRAYNARPVAIIDRAGNVLLRCRSEYDAAKAANVSVSAVHRRCEGTIKIEFDFDFYRRAPGRSPEATREQRHVIGLSFRYLDVNGNPILLGTEGKTAPPAPAPVPIPGRRKHRAGKTTAVVAVDREGRELNRFETQLAAAEHYDIIANGVWTRCNRMVKSDEFKFRGVTFRYADEWDAMPEQDRQADARRTLWKITPGQSPI